MVSFPLYVEETMAEDAFVLMRALARKLIPLNRQMQNHGWAWPKSTWLASGIAGEPLRIVGAGQFGRSFARMAGVGFRAKMPGFDPGVSAEEMRAASIEPDGDLTSLLTRSDFVSHHCVPTTETGHIVDENDLRAMDSIAFLINSCTARLSMRALCYGRWRRVGSEGPGSTYLRRHQLTPFYEIPNVRLSSNPTSVTEGAKERLEVKTLRRCFEILEDGDVLVRSHDPRQLAQTSGVTFVA